MNNWIHRSWSLKHPKLGKTTPKFGWKNKENLKMSKRLENYEKCALDKTSRENSEVHIKKLGALGSWLLWPIEKFLRISSYLIFFLGYMFRFHSCLRKDDLWLYSQNAIIYVDISTWIEVFVCWIEICRDGEIGLEASSVYGSRW